ncbi:AsnC family transcriptional regulator [Spirillospora sp. CA-128828]|uniref:AsnC family transcriptional regulator n=1 Tax=Spirillospora sp. CA-128828 TaxID=3240033 RepID=UPI003D8F473E
MANRRIRPERTYEPKGIDALDLRILAELQVDAKVSFAELARSQPPFDSRIGLPPALPRHHDDRATVVFTSVRTDQRFAAHWRLVPLWLTAPQAGWRPLRPITSDITAV